MGDYHEDARYLELLGQGQEGLKGLAHGNVLLIHADLPKPHDPGLHFIQFQIESLPLGQDGGDTGADPAEEGEEQSSKLGFPAETPGHAVPTTEAESKGQGAR